MPDWGRDAAIIAALAALFNAITGKLGGAIAWLDGWFDRRRERLEARKTVRVLKETVAALEAEREVNTRIIQALREQLNWQVSQRNGGEQ